MDLPATSSNIPGTLVLRDNTGGFDLKPASIVNADISPTAAIVDTKLATIATAGKVSNSATTATSANTINAIVARDGSGNFSAGTITATLAGSATGNAATASTLQTARTIAISGDVTGTATSFNGGANITIPAAITADSIVNADINSAAAIAGTKIDPLVAAGTYTPTVTADTNVTSVGSVRIFQWMRVGSVVTVSGSARLTPTTAGSSARIFISLPIASTFTEFAQLTGVANVNTTTSSRGYGAVLADMATGTRASVNFYPEHTAGRDYNFHWTYQII